jgi:hypothetical protein
MSLRRFASLTLVIGLAATPLALSVGCGSNVSSGGGGSGGNGGNGGATTITSSTFVCSNTGTNCNPNPDPDPCGAGTGHTCLPSLMCRFWNSRCGTEGAGSCEEPRNGCSPGSPLICGCDGQVYESICAANQAGVDRNDEPACEIPAGYFACGAELCKIGEHYCWQNVVAIGDPGTYACQPKPAACGTSAVSCDCIEEYCKDKCEGTAETGPTVTCFLDP